VKSMENDKQKKLIILYAINFKLEIQNVSARILLIICRVWIITMNLKVKTEAPSLRCFQLASTFFGFKPQDRVRNHQNLFNLIWFGEGRWDWNDVYHMPIFLRSYWINQCNEIREARDAAIKKQSQRRSTSLPTKPRR